VDGNRSIACVLMSATREVTYDVDGPDHGRPPGMAGGEGPWPAVLIGHDGIGLDDYQRRRAHDLAVHGYVALAMDYHGGQLFSGRPEAMLGPGHAPVGRC
jgi:dienelactone hydrolase